MKKEAFFGIGFITLFIGFLVAANTIFRDGITLPNNEFFSAFNAAGSATVDVLKVNTSDRGEFGVDTEIGAVTCLEDYGAECVIGDLSISATPVAGTEESIEVRIDGTGHTKFYCETDGSGAAQNCKTELTHDLDLNSGLIASRIAVAAATYSATGTYVLIGVTYTTTAAVTVTLDTDAVDAGRVIIIKDEGGGAGTRNITVDTESTELIDGQASILIAENYGVVRLYSNGTNWFMW